MCSNLCLFIYLELKKLFMIILLFKIKIGIEILKCDMLIIFDSSVEKEIGIEKYLDGQIIISWICCWIWNWNRETNLWSVNQLRC